MRWSFPVVAALAAGRGDGSARLGGQAEDGEQPAGNPLEHAPMVVREALLSTPWRAPSLAHGVHGSLRPQLAHRGSPVRARASRPTVRAECYPPRALAL